MARTLPLSSRSQRVGPCQISEARSSSESVSLTHNSDAVLQHPVFDPRVEFVILNNNDLLVSTLTIVYLGTSVGFLALICKRAQWLDDPSHKYLHCSCMVSAPLVGHGPAAGLRSVDSAVFFVKV